MDADLDPRLRGRLEEELARFPAPAPRARAPHRAVGLSGAIVVGVLVVLIAGVAGAGLRTVREQSPAAQPSATAVPVIVPSIAPSTTGALGAAVVTGDGKNVVDGRQQRVLAVDDDQIVEWFRTKSQLCDAYNITTAPDRRAFCTDKVAFKAKTRFASVVGSPDGAEVGFTITMVPSSDPRSFDSVAGIFIKSTGKVQMLSYLYALDEQFIGFSPTGGNFVYQGGCFEGNCALFVRDSVTLAEKVSVNTGNDRGQTVTFVRWLSDRAFEYKQYTQPFHEPNGRGPELKTASY